VPRYGKPFVFKSEDFYFCEFRGPCYPFYSLEEAMREAQSLFSGKEPIRFPISIGGVELTIGDIRKGSIWAGEASRKGQLENQGLA
jgi:hypothetical protein